MTNRTRLFGACVLLGCLAQAAGPLNTAVLHGETDKVRATEYAPGEEIVFTLSLQDAEDFAPGEYFVNWKRIGDDGKTETGKADATTMPIVVKTKTDGPGFVRLSAWMTDAAGRDSLRSYMGETNSPAGQVAYREFMWSQSRIFFEGGAGVRVDELRSVSEPVDFDAFWAKRKERLARVPMAATVKEHESDDPAVRILSFSVLCAGPRPVTGWVTVPADTSRKYPALLRFHGYFNDFVQKVPTTGDKGRLEMFINAHGYELGREPEYYTEFYDSVMSNGKTFALDSSWQNKSTDTAYFGGMVYRIVRALQYLKTFPEWDGRNLTVNGGSMGGLQAMWAAGLDSDVSEVSTRITWCCDVGGRETLKRIRPIHCLVGETSALRYFDPVNFAGRVSPKCRVEITRAALGDDYSPPTGLAILYNNLKCPKKITWVQGSTHGYVPKEAHQEFSLSASWDVCGRSETGN